MKHCYQIQQLSWLSIMALITHNTHKPPCAQRADACDLHHVQPGHCDSQNNIVSTTQQPKQAAHAPVSQGQVNSLLWH